MKKIYLLVIACISVINVKAQIITIASARGQVSGTTVTVTGIITNGAEFGASLRYIQDATGGIALYGSQDSVVKRGDSVVATGSFTPYSNLSEIALTSINVISSGNTLQTPVLVNINAGFGEQYECQLVQINAVQFTTSGIFVGNTNYEVRNGSDSGQVRITTGTEIVGAPIPTGNINVVGIMGHYGTLFQLLPRDLSDLTGGGGVPLFRTSLLQNNIAPYSFTVIDTTQNKGNTIIIYGTNPDSLTSVVSDTTQTLYHSINLTGLQPATIYYLKGISVSSANDSAFSSVQPMATSSLSSGSIKIYFNKATDSTYSTGTKAINLKQSLPDTLIAYINRAKSTLDIMIYDVDDKNGVITAINNAVTRGVKVRVVLDGGVSATNLGAFSSNVQKIQSPTSASYGIMHEKVMIIDANSPDPNVPVMWTGAADWTSEQLLEDANDVIIFQDQTIARAATLEMNEMWGDTGALPNPSTEKFGPYKTVSIPHKFLIGGKEVESYFAPTDACDVNLENAIGTANKSLQFAIYTFTRTNIAFAFTNAHKKLPIVQGIMDDTTQSGTIPVYDILLASMTSQNIKIDKLPYLFHHKYALIDALDSSSAPQVVAGSYNWTNAATYQNDENQVIIHDATITNIYLQEWTKLFESEGGAVIISGINNVKDGIEQIYLYPNPASDYINLNYSFDNTDKLSVQLIDISGRVLKIWHFSQASGRVQLDAKNIDPGIYLLNLVSGNINRTLKLEITK